MDDLAAILPGFAMLVLWVGSIYWTAKDAERRGKSGCLAALFVGVVLWPFSLLIWLLFRPEIRE